MTQKKPSMSMESHREIEDHAAALLARRDSGDWSAVEQAQLDRWLKESSAHRVAFLRLEAAWEAARRLKAVGAGLPAATVPPPGQWQRSPFFATEPGVTESGGHSISRPEAPQPTYPRRRGRWRYFAIAAAVLLATAGGLYWLASDRWA